MKNRRARNLVFLVLVLLPLSLATPACSSYSYFDLDIKYGAGFNTVTIGQIEICQVVVSGAASDLLPLNEGLCKTVPGTLDYGTIEYSTFADSGNITFTLQLWEKPLSNPACKIGEGTTTLPVGSGTRVAGVITAPFTPPGCK